MKKSLKLLSIAAMLFSVSGMVACKDTKPKECQHTYVEDATKGTAATCTTKGEKVQVCSKCGDEKKTAINMKAHTYVKDDAKSKAATCTEAGVDAKKCSVCGKESSTEIEALGHEYAEKADQTGAVAATCTTNGTKIMECSNCHETAEETVRATGHTLADAADQTGAKAATCLEAGTKKQTCSVCNETVDTAVDALGHDFSEPAVTAKEGDFVALSKATCSRDSVVRYTWAASDVTQNTLTNKATVNEVEEPNVVIAEDGGTQFFGRPKGNAVALNESGNATSDSHAPVFDATVAGSFMEYKFKLAEAVTDYELVADINPAQWLNSTGGMFVAVSANDDWTPGLTAEDTVVEGFRYIVEIDGHEVELDAARNVGGSGRGFYTFPLKDTLNLAAGEHTIKFTMNGGWKHTFYAFGLEKAAAKTQTPVVEHVHAYTAGTKTGAMTAVSCECGKTGVEMVAADLTSGQKEPTVGTDSTSKGTRLGKNIFDDVWSIDGLEAGTYEVYLKAQASANNHNNGYWNSATAIANGDTADNNGKTAELQNDYKYKVKVDNGDYVNLGASEDNYAASGLSDSAANWTTKALATITVGAGAKTITVHNMDNGYSIWVFAIRLVKVA